LLIFNIQTTWLNFVKCENLSINTSQTKTKHYFSEYSHSYSSANNDMKLSPRENLPGLLQLHGCCSRRPTNCALKGFKALNINWKKKLMNSQH